MLSYCYNVWYSVPCRHVLGSIIVAGVMNYVGVGMVYWFTAYQTLVTSGNSDLAMGVLSAT
jgi:hypothetical protein